MAGTRDALFRRLEERNEHPERALEIDDEIWEEFGDDRAIVVSDMSGFTRISRKHGILHFLAMHHKSVEITAKVIRDFGGSLIKTLADNMISVYDDVAVATRCAIATMKALEAYNETVPEPDSHIYFCIGIGYGHIIHLEDDIFGDQVNISYKLGEDIAKAGEILLSEPARGKVPATDEFTFSEREIITLGKVPIGYFKVRY